MLIDIMIQSWPTQYCSSPAVLAPEKMIIVAWTESTGDLEADH